MANIVQTAIDAGQFKTLVEALNKTGLAEELQSEGPFTVFAPTDEAFAELGSGALDNLSEDELRNILLYHVLDDKFTVAELLDFDSIEAMNEEELSLIDEDGKLVVSEGNVVTPDLETDNGVIHVVDKVLIPPVSEDEE